MGGWAYFFSKHMRSKQNAIGRYLIQHFFTLLKSCEAKDFLAFSLIFFKYGCEFEIFSILLSSDEFFFLHSKKKFLVFFKLSN